MLDTSATSSTLEQAILGRSPATLAAEQILVCFRSLPKTKRWIKPWSLLTHISNSDFAGCLYYQTTCSLLKKSSCIFDCLGKNHFSGFFFLFTCMTTLIKHYRTGFSTLQWSSVPSLSGLVSIFILVTKLGTGQTKRKLVWIWCKKRDIVYFILWWSNIFIEASKYWYCNVLIFSNNFLIAGVGMLNLMISMDRKTVVSYFRTALLMIFPASNLSHISVNSSQKVIIHENQCI